MDVLHNENTNKLFEAFLMLDSIDECYAFFEDICTIKEVEDMAQRLKVAIMLNEEKSYQEISKQTGASSATISRVNRCYSYGSGGYKIILKKMKAGD